MIYIHFSMMFLSLICSLADDNNYINSKEMVKGNMVISKHGIT